MSPTLQQQPSTPNQHTPRFKIVVRRLPPHLPEPVFWQSVQQWVTDDTTSWRVFYPGKLRQKSYKENIPSRAYIQFKTEEQIALFSREYDGHVFKDKQGRESQAVVEFAPFQKVPPPPERLKPDPRMGTIENDDDYKSFIESLNAPPPPVIAPVASVPQENKTTPLLEALLAEKTILKPKDASGLGPGSGSKHARHPSKDSTSADVKSGKAKDAPANTVPSAVRPTPGEGKTRRGGKRGKAAAVPAPSTSAPAAASPPKVSLIKSQTPKAPRQQQQSKPPPQVQPAKTQPGKRDRKPPPNTTTNPTPAPAPQIQPSPSPTPTPQPQPQPSRPRRGRPVLGLGSRQFAAAMSHAGVPGPKRGAGEGDGDGGGEKKDE